MERELLRNSIITPDGTELVSRHTHDFVSHTDKNGEFYFIDGGLSYIRGSVNKESAINNYLYSDDSFERIREEFEWGTYGKNGDEPLKYKKLKDLDTDHIEAILDKGVSLKSIFEKELDYRNQLKD